jgi:hypothetical protein
MFAANGDKIKVPTRSEALSAWCLPMMSRSLKADEDEREAFELLKSVENLKNKQAKK